MKIFVSLLLLSVLLAAAQFGPKVLNSGKTMYRYSVRVDRNPQQFGPVLHWIRNHDFDIAGINSRTKEIEVITTADGIALLNRNNIQGRILQQRISGSDSEPSFDARYLSAEKIQVRLKELSSKFPQLTRLVQIGNSTQGRPIWALLISSTPDVGNVQYSQKPTILIDGLHHAREIMTPEVVMDVAETFLLNPTPEHRDLLSRWNIWIVPMLNTDGSNIVWTQDSWWRKNGRLLNNTVTGVDVNRNYPYKWAACNGSSGNPDSDVYRGATAGSEPETQALGRLAEDVRPTAYLSYHSYGEFVLYPFGCEGDLTGEAQLNEKIGHELSTLLPSDANDRATYTAGTPWQLLYSVDGDSMGYMYAEFGATSFTFEINQDFQPAYSLRQPTVEKHRKAWTYFISRLDKNLLTLKVIDGKTNVPTTAIIAINTVVQSKGERPFRTNQAGTFFKVLDPATYSIRVRLNDGREQLLTVTMNGHPQSQTVTVP